MTYARIWRRFIALVLDLAFLSSIVGLLNHILLGDSYNSRGSMLFGIVVGWLYFAVLQSSRLEASLGKILLGVRVVDGNGKQISFGRATVRFFAMLLSAAVFYIGFLMAIFTKRKQALHDLIAGTLVIRKLD